MVENIPQPMFVAVGAIAAALIAGFLSYLNLVISKEQKISQLRRAWIDKLREEVGNYAAAVSFRAYTFNHWKWERDRGDSELAGTRLALEKQLEPSFLAANRACTSIVLRINPNDRNTRLRRLNVDFLATLRASRVAMREGNFDEARSLCDDLDVKVQPILKLEWERVKAGEFVYRLTRYVAAAILIIGLVGAGVSLKYFRGYVPAQTEQPANPYEGVEGTAWPCNSTGRGR